MTSTSGSTSASLIERAKRKDVEAWRDLVRIYAPLVFHWCQKSQIKAEDAADVTQEVFRAVCQGLEQFRYRRPGDSFRGWLLVVTRNKIRDHFRREDVTAAAIGGTENQKLLTEVPDEKGQILADEPSPDAIDTVFRRAIELIRAGFEDSSWHAFWLTTVEGQATADVADQLNMSQAAVRKAKSRVLRRLRDALAEGELSDG